MDIITTHRFVKNKVETWVKFFYSEGLRCCIKLEKGYYMSKVMFVIEGMKKVNGVFVEID